MDEQKQLKILKQLALKAVVEFDDINNKYDEYYSKFIAEETKRKRIDSQFKQLKQVSLLAVAEYESLHKQYIEENKYRVSTEEKLKKVTEENQELRKQNRMGQSTTILPNNSSSGARQETKGELEVLRSLRDAVNAELRNANQQLSYIKEELSREKQAHATSQSHLKVSLQQCSQLKKVSTMAMDEYNELQQKYEIEVQCRIKAEGFAAENVQRSDSAKRRSEILLDGNSDQQVKALSEDIDNINQQMQLESNNSKIKITELEAEIESLKGSQDVKNLEGKVALLMEEIENNQKLLAETEERAVKSEEQARDLFDRLRRSEQELNDPNRVSLLPHAPPPPPPPPPPPMAVPVIKKFISKIGRKKRNEPEEDVRIKAMDDMIARIKSGIVLRSVNSPVKGGEVKEDNDTAVGKLSGLLNSLRTGQREIDTQEENKKKEPEFAALKLKKTNTVERKEEEEENSELKRKLKKQKSIADGLVEEPEEIKHKEKETEKLENTGELGNEEKKPDTMEAPNEFSNQSDQTPVNAEVSNQISVDANQSDQTLTDQTDKSSAETDQTWKVDVESETWEVDVKAEKV